MNEKFKTNFNFIFNIIIISSFLMMGFVWADSNGIWTQAGDIVSGTFGSDEGGGDYIFPNNLDVQENLSTNGSLCVDGECYDNWGKVCSNWVATNAIN